MAGTGESVAHVAPNDAGSNSTTGGGLAESKLSAFHRGDLISDFPAPFPVLIKSAIKPSFLN